MASRAGQWAPNRELQNAKFEGYKLDSNDDDRDQLVERIKFPDEAALPGRTLRPVSELKLGYKEARNRAKWNHLANGMAGEACWIDGEGTVWLIDLKGPTAASPKQVLTLPQFPIQYLSSDVSTAEYPVARHLHDAIWAISDGLSRLYVVDTRQGIITASHQLLSSDTKSPLSFHLHAVNAHDNSSHAILSGAMLNDTGQVRKKSAESRKIFQVMLVRFSHIGISNQALPLQKLVQLSGSDLPSYVAFLGERCCIGSTCIYKTSSQLGSADQPIAMQTESFGDSSDEIVGIPQAFGAADEAAYVSVDPPPPPYSWNQSSDSVAVVFPLPCTVKVKDINIIFRPSSLSLTVASASTSLPGSLALPLPRLLQAKLWDDIDAGISTWTWEVSGGEKGEFGILSIYLEKRNENTRWPLVFKADDNEELDQAFINVEETLDRSELLKITEALEKYTQDVPAHKTSQGTDIEQRSSLLGDEIDLDVDASEACEGNGILFTWINDVSSPSPTLLDTSKNEMTSVISLPIPSSPSNSLNPSTSLILKHDVDGLLFEPPSESQSISTWSHISTYPALSFVMASKRDVVHIYHYCDRICIGLEAGSPVGSRHSNANAAYASLRTGRMNAYLYYPPPPGSKRQTAKQRVLGVAEPSAGAVLGAIVVETGRNVNIVVLCEKQLILLKDVL